MTQENIPIKYTLNMWKSLPGYPTKLDVLYEIYNYVHKNEKKEFSELTLNAFWFDDKGVGNWRGTKKETYVNELMKEGTIKETRKDKSEKSWYVIDENKNPFK